MAFSSTGAPPLLSKLPNLYLSHVCPCCVCRMCIVKKRRNKRNLSTPLAKPTHPNIPPRSPVPGSKGQWSRELAPGWGADWGASSRLGSGLGSQLPVGSAAPRFWAHSRVRSPVGSWLPTPGSWLPDPAGPRSPPGSWLPNRGADPGVSPDRQHLQRSHMCNHGHCVRKRATTLSA